MTTNSRKQNDSDVAVDPSNASSTSVNMGPPRPTSLLAGIPKLTAPTSLLSGALPPALLNDTISNPMETSWSLPNVPSRPRRLWAIQDTALQPIPSHYPPLNPQCATYVGDASPSVVAVRISECLRKRSISVEYDEDSVSATALTVDRCHFTIQLWRGKVKAEADFSQGVVVECVRVSGNSLSFHRACRGILQAAMGQATGDDERPLQATNGREFPRMLTTETPTPSAHVSAAHALEKAIVLLRKDRLDTRELGMERLVDLTCGTICGKEVALYVSLQLLSDESYSWLDYVIQDAQEESDAAYDSNALDSNVTHSTIGSAVTPDEGRHESRMRALAMRVLCNALTTASRSKLLRKALNNHAHHPLTDEPLLNSLVADLKGANRPPSAIEAGTRLASVHEAALAVRILRILGQHSHTVKGFLESELVLERLELARTCGRTTHLVLQQEAEKTYAKLTEDVRSC